MQACQIIFVLFYSTYCYTASRYICTKCHIWDSTCGKLHWICTDKHSWWCGKLYPWPNIGNICKLNFIWITVQNVCTLSGIVLFNVNQILITEHTLSSSEILSKKNANLVTYKSIIPSLYYTKLPLCTGLVSSPNQCRMQLTCQWKTLTVLQNRKQLHCLLTIVMLYTIHTIHS